MRILSCNSEVERQGENGKRKKKTLIYSGGKIIKTRHIIKLDTVQLKERKDECSTRKLERIYNLQGINTILIVWFFFYTEYNVKHVFMSTDMMAILLSKLRTCNFSALPKIHGYKTQFTSNRIPTKQSLERNLTSALTVSYSIF